MAETIGELLQEHRNMAKLLDLLEAELAVYREGGVADFDLLRDIMDYTTSWPERYHHPKENLIFAKLKDKGAEAEALAADLVAEHEKGEELTRGMAPSHTNKKGTRYRYYVSQALVSGNRRSAPSGRRVPAGDVECLVEGRLRRFLTSEADLFAALEPQVADVNACADLVVRALDLAERWPGLAPTEKRAVLTTLVSRIDLLRETLEIRIMPGRLLSILLDENDRRDRIRPNEDDEPSITLSVPARLKRTGLETRLLIDGAGGGPRREPDHSLLRLLGQACRFNEMVMNNQGKTMAELAIEADVGGSYFTRILRLSFLAPDVVKTILRDRHPIELTAKRLAGDTRLPLAWQEQRARLGIA